MKQDNMSMAASIESRVPFLDHVLVEFATRIPREVQIQGLAGKRILKKAVKICCRTRLCTGKSWDFRLRGAGGWVARGCRRFATCCSNPAASTADTSGAKPSKSYFTITSRTIATIKTASGVC